MLLDNLDLNALHKPVISNERVAHMGGVARVMYNAWGMFDLHYNYSRDAAYMIGLIHDMGYMHGKEDHELNGSKIFEEFDTGIADIIRLHGKTPEEVLKLLEMHYDTNIYKYEPGDYIPAEIVLLWFADMMVESSGDKAGHIVGFEKRLEGIKSRYGENSHAYKVCSEQIQFLNDYLPLKLINID